MIEIIQNTGANINIEGQIIPSDTIVVIDDETREKRIKKSTGFVKTISGVYAYQERM